MRTIICNNAIPWFNPFFEFNIFEPVININNSIDEKLTQTPFTYHLKYSVPGFKKKDLKINVKDHTLTVEGSYKNGASWWNKNKQPHVENHFIKRTLLSQDMDVNNIKAKFKNGELNIEIPKKQEFINYREIPVSGYSDSSNSISIGENKSQNIFKSLQQKLRKFAFRK